MERLGGMRPETIKMERIKVATSKIDCLAEQFFGSIAEVLNADSS